MTTSVMLDFNGGGFVWSCVPTLGGMVSQQETVLLNMHMCPKKEMACRALLEGWASFMWRRFSGVLIWKTQNPWSGLRGQLYDWLLAPTGGYYGAMLACEPVHVQLNLYCLQVH